MTPPFAATTLDAALAPVGRWRRWRALADGRPLDVLCTEGSDRRRFARIAALLPDLAHEHLLPCLHAGLDADGRRWVAVAAMPGWTLAEHLAHTGPLPPAVAVRLVGRLARALVPVHARELVHRRIDASQVLLERIPATADDPFPYRPLLAGLGLADDPLDDRDDDPRQDVAALGRLLCRCLGGTNAPPSGTPQAVARLVHELRHPDPHRPVDALSAATACDHCLAGPLGTHRTAHWVALLAALLAALAALAWLHLAG